MYDVQRSPVRRCCGSVSGFAAIAKIVKQMMAEGSKKSRKQLWKIATTAYDEKNQ